MTREEFHRAYCEMPEDYRAELIGGIVFEPSPVSYPHGRNHVRLSFLLESYAEATFGTEVADNATLKLSDDDEVQPDLLLRIVQNLGGQSREAHRYIEGAPELVAEIAYSSRAIDLHLKKDRYALAGVLEYIVVCIESKKIYWFDLRNNIELKPDGSGIFRSAIFPGLWIHGQGLLDLDHNLTNHALKRGLKTAAHAKFAARLAHATDCS